MSHIGINGDSLLTKQTILFIHRFKQKVNEGGESGNIQGFSGDTTTVADCSDADHMTSGHSDCSDYFFG